MKEYLKSLGLEGWDDLLNLFLLIVVGAVLVMVACICG